MIFDKIFVIGCSGILHFGKFGASNDERLVKIATIPVQCTGIPVQCTGTAIIINTITDDATSRVIFICLEIGTKTWLYCVYW